jgi:glycosyltransferase involved in cell wall biosynthesis
MVTHYFESHRGGIEIVAGRLARHLVRCGFEVTWLATSISPPPELDDVRVVSISASNVLERTVGLPYPLLGPAAILRIADEVEQADVVMVHDALHLTSATAALAAGWHGAPILMVQHIGAVPYRNPFLRAAMACANRLVARPLLKSADQVVFISESTARQFADLRLQTPAKLIFNGVDPVFSPAAGPKDVANERRRFDLPASGPVALFVGRFVEKKGLDTLARLAALRPDVTFAFAGWGALDPGAWRLPNVRVFAGLAGEALAHLYRACDFLVLPSVGEGFPLVVQEALACGLPVLCGQDSAEADPAATRLLNSERVDPDDPEGTVARFAEALARLVAAGDDEDKRHLRATFARRRYAWERSAEAHAELMRGIFARSFHEDGVDLSEPLRAQGRRRVAGRAGGFPRTNTH